MTSTPGRLEVGRDGKVTGPAKITHNRPWPCVNGTPGVTGAMRGVVMHTMVGTLNGTIQVFNQPSFQASAHFGIDSAGHIWQFGPLGTGWEAWAQVAGNREWYSIEHEDHGDTETPLTFEQIAASAQLVELLSRFAGFPLQVTDSANGKGYGTHVMGGTNWGGHTCPGPGPRAGQRAAIVALAKQTRAGHPAGPPWQARALSLAGLVESGSAKLAAALPPGNTLSLAQAAEANAAELAALLRAHQ